MIILSISNKILKGRFLLYDEKNLEWNIIDRLKKKGASGFLELLPQNQTVNVKVHCYIVKINSISLLNNFEPQICFECGQKPENQKTEKFNSLKPLFGKLVYKLFFY